MKYTELHLHTGYSLLDGLNTPAEYMTRASEIGMSHLAITDHGVLSGHREFQAAAKSSGITPILGCEMYISPTDRFDRRSIKKRDDNTQAYNHLIVLAQNETGLRSLNKLSEIAWNEGFYSKPRIDMEVLEEHNDGLIVLSGCLNGLISKAIDADNMALAENYTRDFKRIFGERFFMEIQAHNGEKINDGLMSLARAHDIRPLITSDCHYARKEDLWLEEAMLILSTNPKQNADFDFNKAQKMGMLERFNYAYPERQMSFQELELFLHSAEEHFAVMKNQMGADVAKELLDNTMVTAGMVGDYPYYDGLDLLPKPKNGNPSDILRTKSFKGLKEKGLDKDMTYVNRLEEELKIIKDKSFDTYFLIEADVVDFAKESNIRLGPGRGSGAGSLVNYCLGITNVDPIEHNLLFFRFVSGGSAEWAPDFPDFT